MLKKRSHAFWIVLASLLVCGLAVFFLLAIGGVVWAVNAFETRVALKMKQAEAELVEFLREQTAVVVGEYVECDGLQFKDGGAVPDPVNATLSSAKKRGTIVLNTDGTATFRDADIPGLEDGDTKHFDRVTATGAWQLADDGDGSMIVEFLVPNITSPAAPNRQRKCVGRWSKHGFYFTPFTPYCRQDGKPLAK